MKLEVGKTYVNEQGHKYFIGFKNPVDRSGGHPYIGTNERGDICLWKEDGSSVCDAQLVKEWVEPKPIKGWMNLYKSERGEPGDFWACGPYETEKYAREVSNKKKLVACFEINTVIQEAAQ